MRECTVFGIKGFSSNLTMSIKPLPFLLAFSIKIMFPVMLLEQWVLTLFNSACSSLKKKFGIADSPSSSKSPQQAEQKYNSSSYLSNLIFDRILFPIYIHSLFLNIYQQQSDLQLIKILQIDMNPRVLGVTRSIFYRGISLKEYLKKSSATQPDLEYRDQETILVDENRIPVKIDDGFILAETPEMPEDSSVLKNRSCMVGGGVTPRRSFHLPQMPSGKQMKTKAKSNPTERTSTDVSLGSSFEMRIGFLPSLEKKKVARERNITLASRGSSSETTCRKKVVEMSKVVEEDPEAGLNGVCVKVAKNQYVQMRKEKLIKQRYNIGEGNKVNSNKWRVKSYAE